MKAKTKNIPKAAHICGVCHPLVVSKVKFVG